MVVSYNSYNLWLNIVLKPVLDVLESFWKDKFQSSANHEKKVTEKTLFT